jgi:hypothetical protein
MTDSVNIDLLAPAPIVFSVGDQELRFSVLISATDGFTLRKHMTTISEAMESESEASFEDAALELHKILCSLEESKLKENAEASDEDPPTNRETRRKRPTSAAGSAASRKPSATPRRTGSSSR